MTKVLERTHFPTFLRTELSALASAHGVSGAQLAIHQDGRTTAVEVGELEHGSGRPVTRDTAFPIGSVTKAFTATLAMVLVADGDLDLDEPLGGHLPELDDSGDLLTLRHLLSHTAGFTCGPDSAELSTGSLRRYVADHCRRPNLMVPPGVAFSYSNMGYILAGRLIEAITGMSWPEAMASIVLGPLGIEPAFIPGESTRPTATGHSVNLALGRTRLVRQSLAPAEAPAGALAVSAVDLVALGRVHVAPGVPELLPPDHVELMRQAVPAADPFGLADGWGLGLAVFRGETPDTGETQSWVGHDGNADGTACYLRIDPASRKIVALTTNTNTGIGLWQDLLPRLTGAGIPVPSATYRDAGIPVAGAGPSADCTGVYINGDTTYVVTDSDGRLSLAVDGEDFVVSPSDDGVTFALLDRSSGQLMPGGRFQRDPITGEIHGMHVTGRLARRRPYAAAGIG